MSNRVFIYTYKVSLAERASFLGIARSAVSGQPPVSGFGFGLFEDPERPRVFAEIFVMPDPEDDGQDAALEGYRFSSSYQPERSTCIEPGTRAVGFCGEVIGGEASTGDTLVRYTPLWVEASKRTELIAALGAFVDGAEHRTSITALASTEHPRSLALTESFADRGEMNAAVETDRALADSWGTISAARRLKDGLPATFVRCR